MDKKNKKGMGPKINEFRRMFNVFRNNIQLHETSINIMGSHASKYDQIHMDKMSKIIEPKLKAAKNDKKIKIEIKDDELKELLKITKKHPNQAQLFTKNTLVSVVSSLDMLFSRIFEYYYTKDPSRLSIENKSLTYSELKQVNKIEDAQKYLINREVETLLINKGLRERIDILKKDLKLNIPDNEVHIKSLKKLIKIRNLIVHNDNKADDEYIEHFNDDGIKKGTSINVSLSYLKDSLYLVFYFGSYILQDAQIKFNDKKEVIKEYILNDAVHLLLKQNQHGYLRSAYDYAKNEGLNDINKKLIIINYCFSLKDQGKDTEHIRKVLDLEDWSASSQILKLSHASLLNDDEKFYSILEELLKNKVLEAEEISDWYIFKFYEKKENFKKILKSYKISKA